MANARPVDLPGQWHAAAPGWTYLQQGARVPAAVAPVDRLAATGGNFWREAEVVVPADGRYVIDLRNSSLIGRFHHWVFDDQDRLVAERAGGIQSRDPNPFFLRHGRELDLAKGRYRVVTQLESPVFLAQAEPYLDTLEHYRHNIKPGNALVLICLGVFIGLGCYYAALSMVRRRMAERMYTLFILGNLIWNGMCLLVFPDLLGVRWFYLSSFAILFSNCAYIVFVMALLEIRRDTHARLYYAGCAALALMAAAIVAALVRPNWSLELDRYGVGLFITYGLVCGIARARTGNRSARLYLVAIGAFFVLGAAAISLARLDAYTVYIEHVGLLAVTVEVILLALVLAYQFGQLHREKEAALAQAREHFELAHTDALTGLPNRFRLEMELARLPGDGSLTIIDLDGLKHYNDTHGHARGDALLRRFAEILASRLGAQAMLHRLGGDEFAITSDGGNLAWIEDVLEQAVTALRSDDFAFAGASHGSAHAHEESDPQRLLHLADSRMYRHKRDAGRRTANRESGGPAPASQL